MKGVPAPGLLAVSGLLALLAGGCAQVGPVAQSRSVAPAASQVATAPSASAQPGASSAPPAANPLAPPATHTPGTAVASDLLLSGALSGRVQSAQPLGACGRGPAGFAVALRFTLGGAPYVLSVDVLDYRGPGRYGIPPERVAIRSDAQGGTPTLLPATSGELEVDAGESSGRVDAALARNGVNRLRGSWACR